MSNKLVWVHHNSGAFSVKSTYAAIRLSQTQNHMDNNNIPVTEWKKLWRINIQDTLKFLCWKTLHDIIPTHTLIKNFVSLDSEDIVCPVCNTGEETQSHLFLNYSFTQTLWHHSSWALNNSSYANNDTSLWIKFILDPSRLIGIPKEEEHHFQIFAIVAMDSI